MKQLRRQKRFVRASSAPSPPSPPPPSPTMRERQLQRQIAGLDALLQQQKQQQQYRQQEEEIRERLADAVRRYEELYEFGPISFVALDRAGRIVGVNQNAAA